MVDEDNAYKRQFICQLVTELMKEESAGHQNAVLGTRSVVVPRSACTLTAKTGATPNGSAVRAPILEQTFGMGSRKPRSRLEARAALEARRQRDTLLVNGARAAEK